MTRRQKALLAPNVIICFLLNCGLSVIARQSNATLSGRKPASTHSASKVSTNSSVQGEVSHVQALWPWGRVLHGAAEGKVMKGLDLGGEDDGSRKSTGKGSWWQLLLDRVGARNVRMSHAEVDSTLSRWLIRCGEATRKIGQWDWMRINRWVGVSDTGSYSTQDDSTREKGMNNVALRELESRSEQSMRASGNVLSEERGAKSGNLTIILVGLMGIVACGVIGMEALQLVRRSGRKDDERHVRKTVSEERKRNEEVVERVVRDAIDEIVPEEAV